MIPLFRPTVHGDEEAHAVSCVLDSGWWASGPEAELFEEEFAAYTGSRYAVAVSSGTMALKLAARATGLTDGLVVVPALTFISTALAMQQAGNRVLFADINDGDLTINWYSANQAFSLYDHEPGPRGVVPVWYAGRVNTLLPSELPACTRVIEDCAHAAGAKNAGKVGRVACWSFQAVKNLACGDGGMVTTDDEHIAREVRRMRWLGIDKSTWDRDKDSKTGYGWDYDIRALDGEKAQMNDISAAIGRVQLRHLDKDNARRRAISEVYNRELADVDWLTKPKTDSDDSAHMYVVRLYKMAGERSRFIQHMISGGVSAGVHYKPLTAYEDRHQCPLFGPQAGTPILDRVWPTLVTLPLFPSMTNSEVEQVVETVRKFPV